MPNKWGIHIPNGWCNDQQGMLNLGVSNFTVLHHQAESWIPRLPSDGITLVRFYIWRWAEANPREWAQYCAGEYLKDRGGWSYASRGIHVTPANEQNLVEESGGWSEDWYRRIRDWNADWVEEFISRTGCPRDKLHWPAFAYGHSDDNDDLGYVGLEICRSAIEQYGVIDCHPYWFKPEQVQDEWYGHRFIKTHERFPDKPIFCSETGNFDVTRASTPDEMIEWFESLYDFDYILGGTPFIWEDPTGAHGNNNWSRNPSLKARITAAEKKDITVSQDEFLRWAKDVYESRHLPWNPDGGITKLWLAEAKAGRYCGAPERLEHPTENGRYVLQEFGGATIYYDRQTGEVRRGLPLA